MIPALLAVLPEASLFVASLFGFLGAKKFYEKVKDDISLFDVKNSVINPNELQLSDDTHSTKPLEPVFSYDGIINSDKKDKVGDNVFDGKLDDFVLKKIEEVKKDDDISFDVPLQKVDLSVDYSSETLLDVLKSNNLSLVKSITALINSISSVSVSSSVVGVKISKELENLNKLLEALVVSVSSGVMSNDKYNELKLAKLSEFVNSLSNLEVTPDVSVVNNINIDDLVKVLDEKLSNLSEAKELEKEYYEYMKTPKSYSLVDESLPNLAPRDVVALSEAVKAHLNSQEASLTADDVGVDDYDVDISSFLSKLFNFEGIVKDIEKIKGE